MESNPREVKKINLPDIQTSHNYPFSAVGDAQLRAIRQYYLDFYEERNPGTPIDLPFPTAIHLMMSEFCKIKGINLLPQDAHLLKEH